MIPRQPQHVLPADRRRHRRQSQHRRLISVDPVQRTATQHPMHPGVGSSQELGQLRVEVRRRGEAAPRQKRALQIVVEPFHQALGLRVGRLADDHLRAQRAAERLTLRGQLGPAGPPPAHRALPVPHQHPRRRAQLGNHPPPAGIQILSAPRRHQHRGGEPGVTAHHGQHRQQLRRPGLAEPDRQLDVGNQKSHCATSPGGIGRPARRVRRQIHRPQLRHPAAQRINRIRPADPLSNHRRRHPRKRLKQLPDPRLEPIDHRTRPPPLILGRTAAGQRRLHRVPRTADHPGDL